MHRIAFDDCVEAIGGYDFNESGDLDAAEEVHAALEDGAAVDLGIIRSFECPVIPLPARR